MKLLCLELSILAVVIAARVCPAQTNEATLPREGDYIAAPATRRDRACGISGPGARHNAKWTNYN